MKLPSNSMATAPILVVEDDRAHAELILRSLSDTSFAGRVEHVKDGEEALDYLFRRGAFEDPTTSPYPYVVLLDLRLPKIEGLEVLRLIRESPEFTALPVVVLSTSDAEPDIRSAYERRANSYLVKPLDFDDFESLVREIGTYWLERNRLPRA